MCAQAEALRVEILERHSHENQQLGPRSAAEMALPRLVSLVRHLEQPGGCSRPMEYAYATGTRARADDSIAIRMAPIAASLDVQTNPLRMLAAGMPFGADDEQTGSNRGLVRPRGQVVPRRGRSVDV
jgi:hypothetical protein